MQSLYARDVLIGGGRKEADDAPLGTGPSQPQTSTRRLPPYRHLQAHQAQLRTGTKLTVQSTRQPPVQSASRWARVLLILILAVLLAHVGNMGLLGKIKQAGDKLQQEAQARLQPQQAQQQWQAPPQQHWQQPPPQQQQWQAAPPSSNGGKIHAGYFTSWSIYARGYKPDSIPVQHLTHLFYAFADMKPDSGAVFLTDPWADVQIAHDSPAPESELRGNLGALLRLKRANRSLKVVLSIGGWTFSSRFAPVAHDAKKRAEFVRSSVQLLEDHGFDGLDIDWEFPENTGQAADYVTLLRDLRAALDQHVARKGEHRYLLTVAAPAGEEKLSVLRVAEMDQRE